jgi:hypothetical protein
MRKMGYDEYSISNARSVLKNRVNRMIYEKWRIDEYTYAQRIPNTLVLTGLL